MFNISLLALPIFLMPSLRGTLSKMKEQAFCKTQTLENFSYFSTGPCKWLKLFSRC